jgi:hypothetical protein
MAIGEHRIHLEGETPNKIPNPSACLKPLMTKVLLRHPPEDPVILRARGGQTPEVEAKVVVSRCCRQSFPLPYALRASKITPTNGGYKKMEII